MNEDDRQLLDSAINQFAFDGDRERLVMIVENITLRRVEEATLKLLEKLNPQNQTPEKWPTPDRYRYDRTRPGVYKGTPAELAMRISQSMREGRTIPLFSRGDDY